MGHGCQSPCFSPGWPRELRSAPRRAAHASSAPVDPLPFGASDDLPFYSPMIWCSILPRRISFPFAVDIYGKMVGSLILRMRDDLEPDSFPSLLYRYHPTPPLVVNCTHRHHLTCSLALCPCSTSTPPRHRPWSGTSGAPPTTPRTPPKSREPTVAYQRSLCLSYVLRRCLDLTEVLRTAVVMDK